jgi:hypothetical protein
MVDNIWRWLVMSFSALLFLSGINSFRKTLIVIKFREEFLEFDLKEEYNVGKGFIIAVNAKIRGHL